MYVLSAEGLGWLVVTLYALLSRLLGLGMRPLSAGGARGALFALNVARDGLDAYAARPALPSGWLHGFQALFFSVAGASDFTARLPGAILGLVLIASAFALRSRLGRAGGLALAAMLTLSPTVTYFSCSTASAVPALALTMIAIALFSAVARRPGAVRIAALGVAAGLAASADPASIALAAIFILSLALVGLWQLIFTRNAGIRLRVWWERRAAFVMLGIAVAAGSFYLLETDFLRRSFADALLADTILQQVRPLLQASLKQNFHDGLAFYLPPFAFYDFLILILGALGALAFIAFRVRSRMAAVAFLWTGLSVAFFLLMPERRADWLAMILVAAATLAAAGINWLHHTRAWRVGRYPIAALALLTLYVQVLTVFVYAAPDATEAAWARHALFFWKDPATTQQTPEECRLASEMVPRRQTAVFFAADEPALRWYLRNFQSVDDRAKADLIIAPGKGVSVRSRESYDFTFEETWKPDLTKLTPTRALGYLFSVRAWSPLSGRDVRLEVRAAAPTPTPAPAASATPTPVPSAAPTPAASATSAPAAAQSPAGAAPVSTPSMSPSPASAASAEAGASATAAPGRSPASTATASPGAMPSATSGAPPPA